MGCCGGGFNLGGRRGASHDLDPEPAGRQDADPETALKLRLARGEITVDQYRELLDVLRGSGAAYAANR